MADPVSAFVYVDGFNLYRRSLSKTAHKWLDLRKLSELLLPEHEIRKIRYFTAKLKPSPHNPHARQRQDTYLEALACVPIITVHYGHFRIDVKNMPIHPWDYDEKGKPKTIKVKRAEEKGSDVNLATQLLLDALNNQADTYIVISNDSDLYEPIRILKQDLNKDIRLIIPTENPSAALIGTGAKVVGKLRPNVLAAAQLSNPVVCATGRLIHKPDGW